MVRNQCLPQHVAPICGYFKKRCISSYFELLPYRPPTPSSRRQKSPVNNILSNSISAFVTMEHLVAIIMIFSYIVIGVIRIVFECTIVRSGLYTRSRSPPTEQSSVWLKPKYHTLQTNVNASWCHVFCQINKSSTYFTNRIKRRALVVTPRANFFLQRDFIISNHEA